MTRTLLALMSTIAILSSPVFAASSCCAPAASCCTSNQACCSDNTRASSKQDQHQPERASTHSASKESASVSVATTPQSQVKAGLQSCCETGSACCSPTAACCK